MLMSFHNSQSLFCIRCDSNFDYKNSMIFIKKSLFHQETKYRTISDTSQLSVAEKITFDVVKEIFKSKLSLTAAKCRGRPLRRLQLSVVWQSISCEWLSKCRCVIAVHFTPHKHRNTYVTQCEWGAFVQRQREYAVAMQF